MCWIFRTAVKIGTLPANPVFPPSAPLSPWLSCRLCLLPPQGGRQGRFAGYCLVIKTQLSLSVEHIGKDFAHHILAGCIILQKYPGQLVHPQIMLPEELFYRFFVYLHYFISFLLSISSNPQPIGFSGILLAKRQNSFYCTYFLHNRNVADTKSPYPIKRLEVIRWFNQKSMVFNQSLS